MRKLRTLAIALAVVEVCLPLAVPARPAAKAKTSVSLVATPFAIDEGRTAQLAGKVKSSKRSCLKGRTVELTSVPGAPQTTTTNKKGKYAFSAVVTEDSTFSVEIAGTSSCKPATSAERTILVFHLPPPMLEGTPSAPAEDSIPDAVFPNPHPEDFEVSDALGIAMSTREFLIGFAPGTTVGEANSVLNDADGAIVGGDPDPGWVLVRRNVDASADEFLALMDDLAANPDVALVVPEATLQPTTLPDTDATPVDPPGAKTTPEWTWDLTPGGGNWGLEASRAPQAWNLRDELERGATAPPLVGVIDGGFDVSNPDLAATGAGANASPARLTVDTFNGRNPNPANVDLKAHGTAVSGLIAARFGNSQLLDGIAGERATVVGVPTRGAGALTPDEQLTFRNLGPNTVFMLRVIDEFIRLRTKYPAIKIFNASLGFPHDYCHPEKTLVWRAAGLAGTAAQQTQAQKFVTQTGAAFAQASRSLSTDAGVLFVAATGNDSDHDGTVMPAGPGCNDPAPPQLVEAKWASPWCNAALGQPVGKAADWVLCVEATRLPVGSETGYQLAPFSNISGAMAAPGRGLATLGEGAHKVNYPTQGTSFASPLVAGAAAWLYSLGNRSARGNDPAQTLTLKNVKDLLVDRSGLTGDGTTHTLDLFYAAMGIDILKGNKLLQKALVDVDDGSLDGNSRLDDDDADSDGDLDEVFPGGIVTDDKRLGNGFISMSDFRAFRDAMLATMRENGVLFPQDVRLRGDRTHFKFDQNLDGCVETDVPSPRHPAPYTNSPNCALAPKESRYSRFDFNGDGALNGYEFNPSADQVAPFKIGPSECTGLRFDAVGGCLRDIDVLADKDLWQLDQEDVFVSASPPLSLACEESTHWTPPSRLISDLGGPTGVNTPDGNIDYLLSADVHIRIPADPTGDMNHVFVEVTTELPDGDSVDNDSDGATDEPFERGITRCYDARLTPDRTIVTVPLFTNLVKVTVLGRDDDVDGNGDLSPDPYDLCQTFSLRYGQDVKVEASPGGDNNKCTNGR